MPDSYNKTFQILDMFKMAATDSKSINTHNAKRLVDLNNEVYGNKPRYEVIYDISRDGLVDGEIIANVGDILTAGWHENKICGRWALLKDGQYVCDLGSYNETHDCIQLKPPSL